MARLPLNKSSLKHERNRLTTYSRFLPSLDLKRRQLIWELRREERDLAEIEVDIARLVESAQDVLALTGSVDMQLTGLARVRRVDLTEENVVGVRLPLVTAIDIEVAEYSTLARPFWLDTLADKLRSMLELRARRAVGGERVQRLEQAVRKVTQRLNLFEKVLIPAGTREHQADSHSSGRRGTGGGSAIEDYEGEPPATNCSGVNEPKRQEQWQSYPWQK